MVSIPGSRDPAFTEFRFILNIFFSRDLFLASGYPGMVLYSAYVLHKTPLPII